MHRLASPTPPTPPTPPQPARRWPSLLLLALLAVAGFGPTAAWAAGKKKNPPPAAQKQSPELALADAGTIYILVDQQAMVAQIKIRGITLELLPLKYLAFLDYRGSSQLAAPDKKVQLPAIFTVEEDPTTVYRKYIAPEELITVEEAEKLEAERAAAAKAAAEAAKERGEVFEPPKNTKEPPAEPEPPSDYRIKLNEGWSLAVSTAPPDLSWQGRLKEAFHDGLARLRGEPIETPQLLGLTLSPDDARRIHRLLRPGLQILVLG